MADKTFEARATTSSVPELDRSVRRVVRAGGRSSPRTSGRPTRACRTSNGCSSGPRRIGTSTTLTPASGSPGSRPCRARRACAKGSEARERRDRARGAGRSLARHPRRQGHCHVQRDRRPSGRLIGSRSHPPGCGSRPRRTVERRPARGVRRGLPRLGCIEDGRRAADAGRRLHLRQLVH